MQTVPAVVLSRRLAIEMLTEMGHESAGTDVETVSWHVNCSGHTIFLPDGSTAGLRYRDHADGGVFEITCH